MQIPLSKEDLIRFKDKYKRDIVYVLVCVVFLFACVAWVYGRAKNFGNKLKEEIQKVETKYEQKIEIIDNTHATKSAEIERKYNTKIVIMQKKHKEEIEKLKRDKGKEIDNADTPEKRVRLGVDYINRYNGGQQGGQ